MKIKNKILLLATLAIVSTFASCEKEDGDTTPPVIDIISPENGERLEIGKGIHLEMNLSDNNMLKSYKIEIHNSFDGHEHTYSSAQEETDTTPFAYQRSWDISDKRNTHIHSHEIVIPHNATPGNYHFVVYCTDAAGNESYAARNVVLTTEEVEHHH